MFVIFGQHTKGIVDQTEEGRIETDFFHLYYLPIVPVGSYAVTPEGRRPIRLHRRSAAVALGATWLLVALLLLGGYMLANLVDVAQTGFTLAMDVCAAAIVGVGALWWRCWAADRPTDTRRAELLAYGRVIGVPFDPVEIGWDVEALAPFLEGRLRPALPVEASSYRTPAVPSARVFETLAERAADSTTLADAITLARIALHRAAPSDRAQLRRVHARLCEQFASTAS